MLAEGLVILDSELRVLVVNETLAALIGKPVDALIGQKLQEWDWQLSDDEQAPWVTAFRSGLNIANHPMRLTIDGDRTLTFMVNCAPLGNDDNGTRGVVVKLDDMTAVEQTNANCPRGLVT